MANLDGIKQLLAHNADINTLAVKKSYCAAGFATMNLIKSNQRKK